MSVSARSYTKVQPKCFIFYFQENLDWFPKVVNGLLAVSSPAAYSTGVAVS